MILQLDSPRRHDPQVGKHKNDFIIFDSIAFKYICDIKRIFLYNLILVQVIS